MKGSTGNTYKITYINGIPSCSCPAYTYRGKCPHLSPQDVAKLKREASKTGKQIAPLLTDNPAYKTTDQKMADDPKLQEFMDILNN